MQIDHLFGAWRGWGVATGRSSSSKMYIGQRTPLKRDVSTASAGRCIGPHPPRLAWLGCGRNGVNTEGRNPVLPSGPCKPPAFPGAIGSTGASLLWVRFASHGNEGQALRATSDSLPKRRTSVQLSLKISPHGQCERRCSWWRHHLQPRAFDQIWRL